MSYQPSPSPQQGPGPQAPRNKANMWIIGTTVVIILGIILAVALVLTQRSTDANRAGEVGETTSLAASSAETGSADEPTTGEVENPAGGVNTPVGEGAGFTKESCEAFDISGFTDVFASPHKPDYDHYYGNDDNYGSLICSFYTENNDDLILNVTGYGTAESTADALELDRTSFQDSEAHEVTDLTWLGEAGYRAAEEDGSRLKIQYHFVFGIVDVTIITTIDTEVQDVETADAMLTGLGEQAIHLFESYS